MTIGQLYTKVCSQYNRDGNEGQASAWKSVLGEYQVPMIEAAVREWQSDTRPDWNGRPIGAMFPTPADLKNILEREKSKRSGSFVACQKNGCEDGWIRVTPGARLAIPTNRKVAQSIPKWGH
jgi:hypothetical protein